MRTTNKIKNLSHIFAFVITSIFELTLNVVANNSFFSSLLKLRFCVYRFFFFQKFILKILESKLMLCIIGTDSLILHTYTFYIFYNVCIHTYIYIFALISDIRPRRILWSFSCFFFFFEFLTRAKFPFLSRAFFFVFCFLFFNLLLHFTSIYRLAKCGSCINMCVSVYEFLKLLIYARRHGVSCV